MSQSNIIDLSGDGGVLKEIIKDGSGGEIPARGYKVSIHYTGRLPDGTVFDSSLQREPFEFDLGKRQVIRGLDKGVASMKLGEKIFLTCAPEYAYGEHNVPPSLPLNATLIFEVELLGWKGEDLSPNSDGSIERFIIKRGKKSTNKRLYDGAVVKIHLTGKYQDRIFDDRDVEFDYGEGLDVNVIEGVELALEKMTVNETSRLIIQPKYAFGKKGHEEFKIPPNSTVEYIVQFHHFGKGLEEWNMTGEDRVELAKTFKEKGTKYYKKENFTLALKMYDKCRETICTEFMGDHIELKIAAFSNIALCHQKLNQEFDAITACNSVLQLDANNIKALYRRGQCCLLVNDLEQALMDFQKVIELDPTNKAAQNQLQVCKQKITESNKREKKTYANMFSKLAVNDKQEFNTIELDILEECGEWNEEDAGREAYLALKNDSNIVMI